MKRLSIVLLACACAGTEADPPEVTIDTARDTDPYGTIVEPPDTDPPLESGDTSVPPVPIAEYRSDPGAVVLSDDTERVYVVDRDNGVLQIVDRQFAFVLGEVDVGAEPARIARHDDVVWVTARRDGAVVRFRESGDTLVEEARVTVGAGPFGIAAPSADTVYVALESERAVVALDSTTLAETRRWTLDGQPRWLAVSVDDGKIAASYSDRAAFTVFDLAADTHTEFEVPTTRRYQTLACTDRPLRPRITADPSFSTTGDHLYVPVLFADTLATVPHNNLFTLPDRSCPDSPEAGTPITRITHPWVRQISHGSPMDQGRHEPAIVKAPATPLALTEVIGLSSQIRRASDTSFDDVLRGYPSGLVVGRRGTDDEFGLYVSMESVDRVVFVDLDEPSFEQNVSGMSTYKRSVAVVTGGPRGLMMTPNPPIDVWAEGWLGRRVTAVDLFGFAPGDTMGVAVEPSSRLVELPDSDLSDAVQAGRRFFHGADSRSLARRNNGVACASCHPDGGTDQHTWTLQTIDRQTRPLWGLDLTLPMGWLAEGTDFDSYTLVEIDRMDGRSTPAGTIANMGQYLAQLSPPPRPSLDPATLAQVLEGETLFDEAGCATCHTGSQLTDSLSHSVHAGPELLTPRLVGLAATAPYLHDGSAATLVDLLDRAADGLHGDTSALDAGQREALAAFLEAR
jgi:mono/diheme cytochrome c family protein